jgi:hypothetical protein
LAIAGFSHDSNIMIVRQKTTEGRTDRHMIIDKQNATFLHTLAFLFLNTTTIRCMILVTFPDQDFAYSPVGVFEDAF